MNVGNIRVRGNLTIAAKDKDGKIICGFSMHNVITNNGIKKLLQFITTGASSAIAKISFGTSNTTPAETDLAITNAYTIDVSSASYDEEKKECKFTFVLEMNEDNGVTIREAGLVCADGTLFARRVFPLEIEKSENVTVEGYWTIGVSQGDEE